MPTRFLTLDEVAAALDVTYWRVYGMVRRGELRAMKVGGHGVWRVAREDLEALIARSK